VSAERLQGKSVAVLVYATWCPKCNVWSGDLFSQLKEAVKDKPVVVLAINADEQPSSATIKQYITERGFDAPNIVHGWDPTIPSRMGFASNLFHYALYSPEGGQIDAGQAGSFYAQGNGKQFVLPTKLGQLADKGSFSFIKPEMSESLKALLWQCEMGVLSEKALRSAQKTLTVADRKQVDEAIGRFLDGKLEKIKSEYKGTIVQRLDAHAQAAELAGMFKGMPQNQKARQVVAFLEKDAAFKRELAAQKVYQAALSKGDNPKRREQMLRAAAQRFGGTHYGDLAAKESGAAGEVKGTAVK
jgi:hypothetical protein